MQDETSWVRVKQVGVGHVSNILLAKLVHFLLYKALLIVTFKQSSMDTPNQF